MCRGFGFFQFQPAFGNRVDAQARQPCQLTVATVPEPFGFPANVQTSLVLIERAHQEVQLPVQLFGWIGAMASAVSTFAFVWRSLFHEQAPPGHRGGTIILFRVSLGGQLKIRASSFDSPTGR